MTIVPLQFLHKCQWVCWNFLQLNTENTVYNVFGRKQDRLKIGPLPTKKMARIKSFLFKQDQEKNLHAFF